MANKVALIFAFVLVPGVVAPRSIFFYPHLPLCPLSPNSKMALESPIIGIHALYHLLLVSGSGLGPVVGGSVLADGKETLLPACKKEATMLREPDGWGLSATSRGLFKLHSW